MRKRDDFFTKFCSPLYSFRLKIGMSIEEAVIITEVSKNTIYRMESGHNIGLETYDKICRAYVEYGCSVLGKKEFVEKYGKIFALYLEEIEKTNE